MERAETLKILINNKKSEFYNNQMIHPFRLVRQLMSMEESKFCTQLNYIKMFLKDNINSNMIQK